jgi:hypothetical protein
MDCPASRDGRGPQPVTGRLLATGDGVGATPVEGVGLAVGLVLAPTLADLVALAEPVALPLAKLAAGSAQGVAEMVGVAVADVVGVAVADLMGVAGGEQRNGNSAASDAGLLRSDCTQLGRGTGKGFVTPDGSTKPGNGPGVAVGELDGVAVAAPAGQVLASSRLWTCAWLSSVMTVADACVSCAPGKVAT